MGWVGQQQVDSVCCAAKVLLHRAAFTLLSACRRKEVTARCAHAPACCCDTSYQPLCHLHCCHLPAGVLVSVQIEGMQCMQGCPSAAISLGWVKKYAVGAVAGQQLHGVCVLGAG